VVLVLGFLGAGAADISGLVLLAYFVLLLGCAIRFASKIGAFSARHCSASMAEDTLSDSLLL